MDRKRTKRVSFSQSGKDSTVSKWTLIQKIICAVKRTQPLPKTKFGGQPDWLENPQWPISRSDEKPMKFIGQIVLDEELFPGKEGKVAYVFIGDEEEDTWDHSFGDNAVIIQPGGILPSIRGSKAADGLTIPTDVPIKTIKSATGPSVGPEYGVNLTLENEPDELDGNMGEEDHKEEARENYHALLDGTKIGGTPQFVQDEEDLNCGTKKNREIWQLLLQLDSSEVPFDINFGDCGVGYVFINEEGTKGKFFWQCC